MDFITIAPSLNNPLILIGFTLFLLIGLCHLLIRAKIIPPLTKVEGANIIKRILDRAFIIALFVILLGFLLEWWKISDKPVINIFDNISDEIGRQINNREAPFKIYVKGVVSNAKNFYTYIVVDDGHTQYIEPTSGFGSSINGEFSGYCYLGKKDDPNSLQKRYKIFAVVTDREYSDYSHLDKKSIKAESNKIELIRTITTLGDSERKTKEVDSRKAMTGKGIYFFVSSEGQRNDAESLERRLADNGATVYGILNIVQQWRNKGNYSMNEDKTFPDKDIQIRYFFHEDYEVAKFIRESTNRRNVILASHVEDAVKNHPQGELEIWYPWIPDNQPQIKVLRPLAGDEIGTKVVIKGIASLPVGQHLWGVLRRVDFAPQWWPQGEIRVNANTGAWSITLSCGGDQDINWDFDLGVIPVNEAEHAILQKYWTEAMKSHDFQPIEIPETSSSPQIVRVRKIKH